MSVLESEEVNAPLEILGQALRVISDKTVLKISPLKMAEGEPVEGSHVYSLKDIIKTLLLF
jgi:hypothetical protein